MTQAVAAKGFDATLACAARFRSAIGLKERRSRSRQSVSLVRNGTTAIWSKEALHALTNAFWRDIVQALMHQLIQALHPSPTRTPVGQCYEDAPALTRSFVRCILMIASLSPGRKSWEEREGERERASPAAAKVREGGRRPDFISPMSSPPPARSL